MQRLYNRTHPPKSNLTHNTDNFNGKWRVSSDDEEFRLRYTERHEGNMRKNENNYFETRINLRKNDIFEMPMR